MKYRTVYSFIIICTAFMAQAGFEATNQTPALKHLDELYTCHEKKDSTARKRYRIKSKDVAIFTLAQSRIIHEQGLVNTINRLYLHKKIVLHDRESLIDYAARIKESGLSFSTLEPRILRYIKNGDLIFDALTKAIEREKTSRWRKKKLADLKQSSDDFVRAIDSLNLKVENAQKVFNAYAVCVNVFRNEEERKLLVAPKICEKLDNYQKPRLNGHFKKFRTRPARKLSKKTRAYQALAAESALVAEQYHLDDFEKIKMAKCISEQTLHFFSAYKHPLKTLSRTCQMYTHSPSKSFFQQEGICGNFATIAYNIAVNIGFKGRVFLARKNTHFYIEFMSNNEWYHSHPFNSSSSGCDIIKF